MAETLSDAYVSINGVDLSDNVQTVELNKSAALQTATAMGDTAERRLAGLEDWELTVNFYQNYASSKVEQTLEALVGAAQFPIAIQKSKTDAISAMNPEYQGNGMIEGNLPVISADVGQVSMSPVTIVCADGAKLVRDVTP